MRVSLATVIFCACATVHCGGGGSFNGGGDKVAKKSADAERDDANRDDTDSAHARRKTETFAAAASRAPIDMTWVIDNSGSMGDKIDQVNRNFNAFIDTLDGRADLRVAVMTEFCASGGGGMGNLCVDVPEHEKVTRVDVNVGSYNPLAMLAAAQSEAGNVVAMGNSLRYGTLQFANSVEAPEKVMEATGRLRGFYRKDASRVVVVVSDEDDTALKADGYKQVMASLGAQFEAYKLFAFNNVEGSGDGGFGGILSSGWKPGNGRGCGGYAATEYPILARASGGTIYDICAEDWSGTFAELTKAVLKSVESSFQLAHDDVTKVVSVEVDGAALNADDYSVDGGALVLNEGVLADGGEIQVTYEWGSD